MSSQPQTTQVVTPPATTTFPGRDLISIRDLSPIEVETIFHLAGLLKARPANFRTALAGKQMVMFFEKQSLRTRLTFEAGMASMGGNAFFMDQTAGRLDAREKLSDIAHNVERWIDAIVLRTYAHSTVEGMAEHACVPVINALSDLEHPCQALADYFTLHGAVRRSEENLPGLRWRRKQRGPFSAADRGHSRLQDPHRHARGLRARRADRCRRPGHCATDRRGHRDPQRPETGCGRGRRDLY